MHPAAPVKFTNNNNASPGLHVGDRFILLCFTGLQESELLLYAIDGDDGSCMLKCEQWGKATHHPA